MKKTKHTTVYFICSKNLASAPTIKSYRLFHSVINRTLFKVIPYMAYRTTQKDFDRLLDRLAGVGDLNDYLTFKVKLPFEVNTKPETKLLFWQSVKMGIKNLWDVIVHRK